MAKYEVTLGYYKTVIVEADCEDEAIDKGHQGNWLSEGGLTASDNDEAICIIEE